ncbi:MAG TPA: DUF1993 domain-containing protein [Woeseiaceae bacterium]|nr:DUF1993 domain-containing protein [Woeseiaceae bacterium]
MSISVFDQTIGAMSRALLNTDAIIGKGEEYAKDRKIDDAVLLQARLFPDMLPLVSQIRIATDTAKGAAARLSGSELPSWPDDETTFEDVHTRIRKALDYLSGFKREQFDGSEDKEIELKLGKETVQFTGQDYILGFVLPNFYFHLATAYNILRHNGVAIGKRDFLGDSR